MRGPDRASMMSGDEWCSYASSPLRGRIMDCRTKPGNDCGKITVLVAVEQAPVLF